MTKDFGKYPCLANVKGQDLIGLPLKAPLTSYEVVYALPMQTISMGKGTGIVTSVPSDSPDDWAALRDLQTKKGLREKYNVKEEWCLPFEPRPIINIPEFGNLTAVKLVEDLKIQSQKDKEKLAEAKDKAYLKGFYEGVMLVGLGEGMKIEKAKPIIKKHMLDNGLAAPYYEPEGEVVSRTGDDCVVALCDQWFLTYGEEHWRDFVKSHVKGPHFKAYNGKTQQEFEETLDWLNQWACSRTAGLGTKLPWDTQFLIESLSDSTIYMAYYTVAHLIQGGHDNLNGQAAGPLGLKAEDFNDATWEYIFKRGQFPADSKIPEVTLAKLRSEFEYWYPMDLRCSGKDLIRNHLTMSLYNHAAVWNNDPKFMPRGFFCNGYVLVDGDKMSKSKGNFMTVRDCIDKYGVDATRVALADAGDTLDDANFD
jgi:leucyl-tRNA synthetase